MPQLTRPTKQFVSWSINSPPHPNFMKPEISLSQSQEPATCPCPEPDQSTHSGSISLSSILILFSHLRLGLSIRVRFRHHSYPSLSSTRPAHLIAERKTPMQTHYFQHRFAIPSQAEAANSIRKHFAPLTEYQPSKPKFHRLGYTSAFGYSSEPVPLAALTCLDGRCWRVSWGRV